MTLARCLLARRHGLAPLACALAVGLASSTALADDTVFFKKGGRLRGTVIEEDPTKGVRVKIYDGTVRTVPTAEVDHVQYGEAAAPPVPVAPAPGPAPAPSPGIQPLPFAMPTGELHVEAAAAATVTVDGGEVGKAPADVHNLAAGRHRVRVKYDEGGTDDRVVFVTAGATVRVDSTIPETQALFNATRNGVHFGVGVEPIFMLVYKPEGYDMLAYEGARLNAFMNVGLSPAVDFRLTAFVTESQGKFGAFAPVGGIAALRFNAGTVYTAELGFEAGYAFSTNVTEANQCAQFDGFTAPCIASPVLSGGGFLGVDASLLSFRFGSHREFEVELRQGMMMPVSHSAWFENGLVARYLFLPGGIL